jgi:hypothetical protein
MPKKSPIFHYKPLIVKTRVFPIRDPRLREIKALKKYHEQMDQTEFSTPGSRYALDRFELRLQGVTQHDLIQSMRRFFLNMIETRIELTDKVEFGVNTYDGIALEDQHLMRRRINSFLAQLAHVNLSDGIPLKSNAPQWALECVTATLTIFKAIKKMKKIAVYCDQIPFPENVMLDSPDLCAVRGVVFAMAYEKFPKLSSEARRAPQAPRRRSGLAKESDELTYDDVVAAAFLLPHIMRPETVKDFMRAEVALRQKLGAAGKGSDEGQESGEGDE